jgi:DNA-binding LytR/AlgR family response regulator
MTPKDTLVRLPVKAPDGTTRFFDLDDIYYLEAREHDTLVRAARRTAYRSTERLSTLAGRLPCPPFFRCHNTYLVNLLRVRRLERKQGRDYSLRLEPPVNRLLPLARGRVGAFRKLMGAP